MPASTGIAVKDTFVPSQIAPEGLAEMLTVGVRIVLTSMIMVCDTAVLVVTQGAFDTITQTTWLLSARVALLKVLPLPEGVPFTNQE